MKLDITEWKPFFLSKLFKIRMGSGLDKDKMTNVNPKVNFVSRVSYNNGVDIKVDKVNGVEPFPAGFVTVALGGSYLGSCFVQEEIFYTAQNVAVMESVAIEMTHNVKLFISNLVRFECKTKYYAFGRELNTHINSDFSINLPIQRNIDGTFIFDDRLTYSDDGYIPDWQFMEDYIKSLNHKPITTRNIHKSGLKFDVTSWEEFTIGRVFNIKRGQSAYVADNEYGTTPYASASGENNGISNYLNIPPNRDGNCIVINYDGSVGDAYYQPIAFFASEKIVTATIKGKNLNPWLALFIIAIIKKEKFRFSYGRKWTVESSMKKSIIKLPIRRNLDGTPVIDSEYTYSDKGYIPDWEFMEEYIKSLPYSDRIEFNQ